MLFSALGCYDLDGMPRSADGVLCPSMQDMWYLDLSHTARDESWETRFRAFMKANGMPRLKVLKLKGLRLTDSIARSICECVPKTLWSLDLRDNLLTDQTIRHLYNPVCVYHDLGVNDHNRSSPTGPTFLEDSPEYTEKWQSTAHQRDTMLRPDLRESFVNYVMANGKYIDSSAPSPMYLDENDPLGLIIGLTHLYLSGNKFTTFGIETLLHYRNRLQVLDVGAVRSGAPIATNSGFLPDQRVLFIRMNAFMLSYANGVRLENLRIHHSVVTTTPTVLPTSKAENLYSPVYLEAAESAGQGLSIPFRPLENNRLRSLTLTNIPTKSYGYLIERLIWFLQQCVKQEKEIDQQRVSHPKHRNAPILFPGLRELRLEFVQEETQEEGSSISGDRDADEFLSNSLNDFSFFASEKSAPRSKKGAHPQIKKSLNVMEELRKYRASCAPEDKWGGKITIVPISPR